MRTHPYLTKNLPFRRMTPGVGFVVGLALFLSGTSCLALQTYPLVDQQKTEVVISQSEQNRIAVLGDRIQQVFGANGVFDVESDEDGGQIFLISTRSRFSPSTFESSSPIKPTTITIITEEGLTQDLKLMPKEIEAQSILFKPALSLHEENTSQRHTCHKDHLSQVIKLLKAMAKNEELTGFTNALLDKDDPLTPFSRFKAFKSLNLKVKEVAFYSSPHYEGRVYTISNQGEKSLTLKESDFAMPHDPSHRDVSHRDSALSLSKTVIHPDETITLYVVMRKEPTQECTRRGL